MKKPSISELRNNYGNQSLHLKNTSADPIIQFDRWFNEALQAVVSEPNAMTLATCNAQGRPGGRVVLLKGFDERGFVFFTNYQSNKARDLARNPWAALVFHWLPLHRQVRIEGRVEKVSYTESKTYFQSRPRGSQIGAWASPQSQTISDRSLLEGEVTFLKELYADKSVLPCPPHWGGYLVLPDQIEFWQGRNNRLHDRIQYLKVEDSWEKRRLAP